MYVCMYKGWAFTALDLDPQWSIVLNPYDR
jgi:hypothetical protein